MMASTPAVGFHPRAVQLFRPARPGIMPMIWSNGPIFYLVQLLQEILKGELGGGQPRPGLSPFLDP